MRVLWLCSLLVTLAPRAAGTQTRADSVDPTHAVGSTDDRPSKRLIVGPRSIYLPMTRLSIAESLKESRSSGVVGCAVGRLAKNQTMIEQLNLDTKFSVPVMRPNGAK